MMYRNEDVVGNTKIQIYCDSKTKFKREEDIVKYVLNKNEIKINFNMNPYKLKNFLYPKYIGLASKYRDCNEEAIFQFKVINHNEVLEKIFVEFKYSEANRILDTFSFLLKEGENILTILIKK